MENRVPVAAVLLHDEYTPPNGVYYFRQSAFSQFNGRRLVAATRRDVDRDLPTSFPTGPIDLPEVPNEQGDRALLDTTVALLAEHQQPFTLESPVRLGPAANPDTSRFKRVYRVTSAVLSSDFHALLGHGNATLEETLRTYYTQGPGDPRYRELAQRVVKDLPERHAKDPLALALGVAHWLSEQGIYSLKSRHAGAEDPTADFLFGDVTGYCVHFAHAGVYMMRALGVPARVAAGYVFEESGRRGGSTIVLSGQNAHAWPEVYLTGVGWVVVDIAPQRSLDAPPEPPDPDLQNLLGELARGEQPAMEGAPQAWSSWVAKANLLPRLLGQGILALTALGLLWLYAVKLWRRGAPLVASDRALGRRLYRRQLDRLSDLSLARNFGEARERFA